MKKYTVEQLIPSRSISIFTLIIATLYSSVYDLHARNRLTVLAFNINLAERDGTALHHLTTQIF